MQENTNDYINAQLTRDTIGSYWTENLKFSNCPIEQNVCRSVHDRRWIRSGEMWQSQLKGLGIMFDTHNGSLYEGYYVADELQGEGRLIESNGHYFIGVFEKGRRLDGREYD